MFGRLFKADLNKLLLQIFAGSLTCYFPVLADGKCHGKRRNEAKICGTAKRYPHPSSFRLIFREPIYLTRLYFEFGDQPERYISKLGFNSKKFTLRKKIMEDYSTVNCFNSETLPLPSDQRDDGYVAE